MQQRSEIGMMAASGPRSSREKVRGRRRRLREQGRRAVQVCVLDVRTPAFRAEAHRQSLAIAASAQEADDQAFIYSVSDL